jgi:hypothetical protein
MNGHTVRELNVFFLDTDLSSPSSQATLIFIAPNLTTVPNMAVVMLPLFLNVEHLVVHLEDTTFFFPWTRLCTRSLIFWMWTFCQAMYWTLAPSV